ncbi:hypothetical protein FRB90_003270, partial [Tulasnella sp. 427]
MLPPPDSTVVEDDVPEDEMYQEERKEVAFPSEVVEVPALSTSPVVEEKPTSPSWSSLLPSSIAPYLTMATSALHVTRRVSRIVRVRTRTDTHPAPVPPRDLTINRRASKISSRVKPLLLAPLGFEHVFSNKWVMRSARFSQVLIILLRLERVLSSPEMLSIIVSFLGHYRKPVIACVCRAWAAPALDFVWHTLDSVVPLLELVGYHGCNWWYTRENEYLYEALSSTDWGRFASYASRIRTITNREDIHPKTVSAIAMTHPSGRILVPNLRKLVWAFGDERYTTNIIPFLSRNLEELEMDFLSASSNTAPTIFRFLVSQTPKLKRLLIRADVLAVRVDKAIAKYLQTTPALEELWLPPYYQTDTIVAAVSRLRHLKSFLIVWNGPRALVSERGMRLSFRSVDVSTGSLERLAWNGYSDQALTLLQSREHVKNIRELEWNCPSSASRVQVLQILDQVYLNCTQLRILNLNLFRTSLVIPPSIDLPSIDLLRPLFECTALKEITIHTFEPFLLTECDVADMAGIWTDLEVLILSPEPEFAFGTGTPLSIFPQLAQALPKLRSLGFYFLLDAFDLSGDGPEKARFHYLKELDVGNSPISEAGALELGFFIGDHCENRPKLLHEMSQRYDSPEPGICWLPNQDGFWKDVRKGMDLAIMDPWRPLRNRLCSVNWDHFTLYTSRVKRITNNVQIHPEALAMVAFANPRGPPLVPKLKQLAWTLQNDRFIMNIFPFLSNNLESLEVHFDHQTVFFRFFLLQTPNIKRLAIRSSIPVTYVGEALAKYIQTTPALQELRPPQYYQTEVIVAAAGRLRHLKSFLINWSGQCPQPDELGMCLTFDSADMFTGPLERLAWNGYPDQALAVVQSTAHVKAIQELAWSCPSYGAQTDFQQVLIEAALNCSNLRAIKLMFFPVMASPVVDPPSMNLLRPLFMCPNLKEVHIQTSHPFVLTSDDITELAGPWGALDVLVLSPDACHQRTITGTPVSLFPELARAFPNLRLLGLYFIVDSFLLSNDSVDKPRFRCLKQLELGCSPIFPQEALTEVGYFFDDHCENAPGVTRLEIEEDGWRGLSGRRRRSDGAWDDLLKSMRLAVKVRQARARVLFIPEVLSVVISFLDTYTKASAVRVCRTWGAVAIDSLWHTLDSASPLLELLAHPEAFIDRYNHSNAPRLVCECLCSADWNRFSFYASRVKTMTNVEEIHPESMAMVVMTHPYGSKLVPNLRKLVWIFENERYFMNVIPFVACNLEELELHFPLPASPIPTLFRFLVSQTPELKRLRIRASIHSRHVEEALATYIQSTPALAWLPPYYQTKTIVAAAS